MKESEINCLLKEEFSRSSKTKNKSKIIRDKSHDEQIVRWAEFVRDNLDKWKAKQKAFIDAQIIMARRFYKKLGEIEEGRQKIIELKNIRINA